MTPPVVELSAEVLAARLASGEPLCLFDVREPWERQVCVIAVPPTARELAIPMNGVPERVEDIRREAASDLIVYCHHGIRSRRVAEWLAEQGIGGLSNLAGGIDAWAALAGPSVARY